MNKGQKVLIVGAVAGGASAATRLRRLDEQAHIILFERGEYVSFANCALPYYIGGKITEKSALTLQTPNSFKIRFNIGVRIFNEVISINKEKKEITVKESRTGKTYTESYDKLILSMGAEPIKPPIEGSFLKQVFTLRNIPDTYKIKEFIDANKPKKAVVMGGGYIGLETAENLHRAGLEVTIVEMGDQVIASLDYDMACDVHRHIISKGVDLRLKTAVKAIAATETGLSITTENTVSDGKTVTAAIKTDMLIMAVGVRPESTLAKNAGLLLNERGFISVSSNMCTSDADIFAVGDVVEVINFVSGEKTAIALAGPANKQGRIAADNICGIASTYAGTQGSAILKIFDMTVAATGLNEKAAKKAGFNYDVMYTYSANHATYYPGAKQMAIKTVFEKEGGKILGAQITGYEGVDKRADIFATAIRAEMTAYDLTKLELCYAPPYSSAKDPVNMVGFAIENVLTQKVKQFHWHEIEQLPKDGSVIFLDTRTKGEYENGHPDNFINIPLDELRSRVSELDVSKKVYITCQVGLRGYMASRILSQNGFDVYNLSGGYRLYSSIFAENL